MEHSNFDKRCSWTHFMSFLFYYYSNMSAKIKKKSNNRNTKAIKTQKQWKILCKFSNKIFMLMVEIDLGIVY